MTVEEKVYMEISPNHYVGSFPSVTIHFREKDRLKAESLKRKILELLEKEGGKQ